MSIQTRRHKRAIKSKKAKAAVADAAKQAVGVPDDVPAAGGAPEVASVADVAKQAVGVPDDAPPASEAPEVADVADVAKQTVRASKHAPVAGGAPKVTAVAKVAKQAVGVPDAAPYAGGAPRPSPLLRGRSKRLGRRTMLLPQAEPSRSRPLPKSKKEREQSWRRLLKYAANMPRDSEDLLNTIAREKIFAKKIFWLIYAS